jgi:hypothetical protein
MTNGGHATLMKHACRRFRNLQPPELPQIKPYFLRLTAATARLRVAMFQSHENRFQEDFGR